MDLTPDELKRYERHLILPEVGKTGQLKLKNARVLLIGAGGLGSPLAMYLAAAGIGTIGIADADTVDFSNLQRQVIHGTSDVGTSKVSSAKAYMENINPEIDVIAHETRVNADNILALFEQYDYIVDGTDNFPTRYLINDACVMTGKPNIFGAVYRFEGQCSVFALEDGPCYRCLFADPPAPDEVPSCAEAGVLGILPGIIGLLQANETVKLICDIGEPLKGRLLIFDALKAQLREVQVPKDPECPVCGTNPTITKLKQYDLTCKANSDRDIPSISSNQLKQKLDDHSDDIYILDVRKQTEWDINRIEGAILKPLDELKNDYHDIPQNKPVYVHCKAGGRSLKAIQFLQSKGFTNCVQIKGGIDAFEALPK